MWKLVKINIFKKQFYSKKKSMELESMKKVMTSLSKMGKPNIIEDSFIPSIAFGNNKEIDITLSGFFFIKIKEENWSFLEKALMESYVFPQKGDFFDEDIEKIKNKAFDQNIPVEEEGFKEGDAVNISEGGISMGKIIEIKDDFATVSFFLFGQENKTTVHVSAMKKIEK